MFYKKKSILDRIRPFIYINVCIQILRSYQGIKLEKTLDISNYIFFLESFINLLSFAKIPTDQMESAEFNSPFQIN